MTYRGETDIHGVDWSKIPQVVYLNIPDDQINTVCVHFNFQPTAEMLTSLENHIRAWQP